MWMWVALAGAREVVGVGDALLERVHAAPERFEAEVTSLWLHDDQTPIQAGGDDVVLRVGTETSPIR